MDKYKIVESTSGHCCFTYTVVDSTKVDDAENGICECFEKEDAEKVCDALNLLELAGNQSL